MKSIIEKKELVKEDKNNFEKRLFIAIDIPEFIKDDIYNFTVALLKEEKQIKVVSAPNIHITLKFLGNINTGKINKIEKAIKETADTFGRFKYEINGKINAFPGPNNARVVFLEIGNGGRQISEIYNELESNLSMVKTRKEKRKFFPHITIARIKNKKNIEQLVNNHEMDSVDCLDCLEITLFESRLKLQGAEYAIINKFSLK
ncbi:RNA 2',3'-cyclic phosphodiesterase [subsurface metagenome]